MVQERGREGFGERERLEERQREGCGVRERERVQERGFGTLLLRLLPLPPEQSGKGGLATWGSSPRNRSLLEGSFASSRPPPPCFGI